MLLFFINLALFALFYTNTLMLVGLPLWWGLAAIIPLWVARLFSSNTEIRILSTYTQASLFVGTATMVAVVLQNLLQAKPVAERLLLPLLVAVVVFYVLHLYIRLQQIERTAPEESLSKEHAPQGAISKDQARVIFWVAGPSLLMSFALAVVISVYALFALSLLAENLPWLAPTAVKFIGRGIIPPITLIFFFWAALILLSKWVMLSFGARSFFKHEKLQASMTARGSHNLESNIQSGIESSVAYAPSKAPRANSKDFIERLWQHSSESYLLPKYLNWSIPILGFIGTVLGISLAADGIRGVIASQQSLSELSSDLGDAIAPLGIAFDTTLIALSLSILLTLLQTLQHRAEDRVLNTITRTLAHED